MCGFAGEFLFKSSRADLELARTMAGCLRHRGPDESGAFLSSDGRCAIGFRRLAVLDPAGSHQPMSLPGGVATVAFNGEIYNFRSLRQRLANQGAVFATRGDTEVLLHAHARLGHAMLEALDGMFAFALYDATARTLLLARDRLGQKPLWYATLSDRIVFASEAKALLAHPAVALQTAPLALTHYLSIGYVPAPHAIWSGIRKLQPGHSLSIADTAAEPVRYWQPCPAAALPPSGTVVEHVRDTLARAVEHLLVADVPIGALLSGGVDSSIVVALMAKAAGATGGVRTFTAGFDDQRYDERPIARKVASHCGTDHTELLVKPDPAAMLDPIVDMYDEPFADSSALPTSLICHAARQHVTVALTGDGGDEVFAGYDRYRAMRLGQTLGPAGYLGLRLAAAAVRPWAGHHERSPLRRLIRLTDGLLHPPAQQYFTHRHIFTSDDLYRLLSADFAAAADLDEPQRWFCDLYEDGEFDDEVTRAQHHDLLTYLPDDLLVKTDIASMAASLELRAPMLEHRVVELGLALPTSWKIRRGRGKAILRAAFADLLPREVFSQPKRGFGVPLGKWLRNELRPTLQETLLDRGFLARGIFRPEAIVGLVNDHLSGRDDHSHRLWALLVLARWLDKHDRRP